MSLAAQIQMALRSLAAADNPATAGEDAQHVTASGATTTPGLRAVVVRDHAKIEEVLAQDWVARTAKVTVVPDDWPAVATDDFILLADGRWKVETDPISVSGLAVFQIVRSQAR